MSGRRLKRVACLLVGGVLAGGALAGCVTEGGEVKKEISNEEAAAANLNLGAAYLRQGDIESALTKLQKAVDLDDRNPQAHATLALAFERVGLTDEADQHYKTAVRVSENNPIIDNMYGAYLCRNKAFDEAQTFLIRAARNPRYRTPEAAYTNAGVCALRSDQAALAEEHFRSALTANPRYPDALWNMASLSYERERHLQARAFLQRLDAVTALPSNALWLGLQVEKALGNTRDARRFADELKEKHPTSRETAQLLELERNGG